MEKAGNIAVQRFQLLSPLLAQGLDAAKLRELKAQVCKETGLSERIVRRYLSKYRNEGFGGLKPQGKPRSPSSPSSISPELLGEAVLLRREVPTRSVSQIIEILEWEGKVAPGQIKRSTLQENLAPEATAHVTCECTPKQGCITAFSAEALESVVVIGHQIWTLPTHRPKWYEAASLPGCHVR